MTTAAAPTRQFATVWGLDDFAASFSNRCADVDCVVGLARAAPRLLETQDLLESAACPVFCERAIDYLPRGYFAGKAALLFDDTINFGSTMDAVRMRLESLGAAVECFAAAVDTEDFLGRDADTLPSKYLRSLKAEWVREFSHHQIGAFHSAEVSEFRRLGKPYTLDYPVLTVPLSTAAEWYSPSRIAELIGESADRPFFWPSSPQQLGREVHAFSIPIQAAVLDRTIEQSHAITWRPYSKLRLYLDIDEGQLRVASMAQFDTHAHVEDVRLTDPCAEAIWRLLKRAVVDGCASDDAQRALAYHRALVFAVSISLGRLAWRNLLGPAMEPILAGIEPELDMVEPTLIFGRDLGFAISEAFAGADASPPDDEFLQRWAVPEHEGQAPQAPSDVGLWERINAELQSTNGTGCPSHDVIGNLGALLPILRKIIDDDLRDTPKENERLQKGLTFSDLLLLMRHNGVECTVLDLSFAIDVLVDDGMLVPQLVFRPDSTSVVRAYRSGEADRAERTRQLKALVHPLLSEWAEKGHAPLSEKGFSKTFAILRRLFPELPYTTGLRPYGTESLVDETEFRRWCEQHGIIDLHDSDDVEPPE